MTNNLSEFPSLERALERIGDQVIDAYRRKLDEYQVNASGRLGNSLKIKVEAIDGTYDLYLQLEDYWRIVEDGRKAGKFPNIDALKKWIRVKPVIPTVYGGRLPSIDQLAFLIGRKIQKEGIPPKRLLSQVLDNIDLSPVEEALDKDLNNTVDIIIKEL